VHRRHTQIKVKDRAGKAMTAAAAGAIGAIATAIGVREGRVERPVVGRPKVIATHKDVPWM